MDMKDVLNKFQTQKRLVVIVSLGVIAIGAVYFMTLPEPNQAASTPPTSSQAKVATNSTPGKAGMPKVYQPPTDQNPLRDPFDAPPGYKTTESIPGSNPAASNQSYPSNSPVSTKSSGFASNNDFYRSYAPTREGRPVLNGVITSENKKVAIIQQNGESHVYRLNDYVDGYRVADISGDKVTLRGQSNSDVMYLQIGR